MQPGAGVARRVVADRPVKCTLSREESLRMHAKRHPIHFDYEAGCDADGHLTALRVRGIGDSGAYASVGMKVLERAAGHACGPTGGSVRHRERSPSARTIWCAARSAGSVPTRRSSRSKGCSIGSPNRWGSAAGRSASAT